MKTVTAIHIDPINKTITEITIPASVARIERNPLRCETAEAVTLASDVDAWVDQDALSKDWDAMGFSILMGTHTLAGPVVITGSDEKGRIIELPPDITVELVEQLTTFADPKTVRVPGPREWHFNEKGKRVVKLLGPEWLTYENH